MGNSSAATRYNEFAHAAGQLAAQGDRQGCLLPLFAASTGTSWATFYTKTPTVRFAVQTDSVLAFSALIVGRLAGGSSGAWKVEGAIKNNGGTVAFIGTPAVTLLGRDSATWDVQVVANDTNKSLDFQAHGDTGQSVKWSAYVRYTEILLT